MPKSKLPDAETLRRAMKNLEALFSDQSAMDRVFAQLQQIEDEAEQRKQAVLESAGLPPALVANASGLSSPVESATIRNMPQPNSATAAKKPEKRRKNGRESAVYLNPDALARQLGFEDLESMAKELGQTRATARSWRARGYIPPRLHPKIDALKLLRPQKQ